MLTFLKKIFTFKKIFEALMIFWTLFIFYKWFSWNNKVTSILFSDKWLVTLYVLYNNSLPFFVGLFFSLVLFLFLKRKSEHRTASLKISPIIFIVFFTTFTSVLYFLSAYIRVLFPAAEPAITTGINLLHVKNFFYLLLPQILWILVFSMGIFLLGNIIYKFLLKKYLSCEKDEVILFLIKFSLGIILWSFISFFLAFFSFFYKSIILIIFSVILLLEHKTVLQIFKLCAKKIEFKITLNSYFYWIVMLFILFVSMLLINSLQLFSRGFDNLIVYLNIANIVSNTHSLISGYYPYPYSLLASIGFLFAKNNALFALGNQIIYGIVGMVALFKSFSFFVKNKKLSFLLSFLWISLPLTTYYFSEDAKVELLLFYTCTVSVILFLKWLQTRQNIYIYLTAITLSFSFSVKILAIFLIISFIPIILYNLIKFNSYSKLKTVSIFIGLGMLISSPWIIYSLSTHKNNSNFSINSFIVSKNKFNAGYITQNDLADKIDISLCKDTTPVEDLSRFQSQSHPLLKPIIIPWELLKNRHENVNKTIVNIGFILIIFYGLFYIFYITKLLKKEKIDSKTLILLSMNAVYWILWGIFGKEIIWYGYSGFTIFFLSISALLISISHKYRYLYMILIALILLNITTNLLSFTRTFANSSVINYISKRVTYDQKIFDLLNTKENKHKRIYSTAERSIYQIKANNERVLIDSSLGYFSCLTKNYTNDQIKNHLKNNLKVDYVLYSLGKPTVTESNNTLVKKAIVFYNFSKNNLELIEEVDSIMLFRIK